MAISPPDVSLDRPLGMRQAKRPSGMRQAEPLSL